MTFLQPAILFGLPLIAVPILIHLLNRARYQSRPWAAMNFLLAASRRSRRQARLRHWLILLCRVLAVLALVLVLARPLVGGWLGWVLHGGPDTVIVLLDRSASMAVRQPGQAETKCDLAVARLAAAAGEMRGVGQVILIDSASLVPRDIGGLEVLPLLREVELTDTAADIPQLLSVAIETLISQPLGQAEIWLASDLQAVNWDPGSPRWTEIGAQLAELPYQIPIRLLALPSPAVDNVAVRIHDLKPITVGERTRVDLVIDIERHGTLSAGSRPAPTFPLSIVIDGARRPLPVRLEEPVLRLHHQVTLDTEAMGGWGYLELPADTNLGDNRAYFVFHPARQQRALVVSQNAAAGRWLALAAAPSPVMENLSATILSPAEFDGRDLADISLVIWQGDPPTGSAADRLATYLEQGGLAILFPSLDPLPAEGGHWAWSPPETVTDPARPYRVTVWEDRDGLLARTGDGTPLLVNELNVRVRSIPRGAWSGLGSFADGSLFLGRRTVGRGSVYACSTLPTAEWSDLGNGMVLVPMIQRALQAGGVRLGLASNRDCGDPAAMTPLAEAAGEESWSRVDTTDGGPWQAGIYRAGPRWLALNRPSSEDTPQTLDEPAVRALFEPHRVRFFEDKGAETVRRPSELWRILLAGMLLLLLIESFLALPGGTGSVGPGTSDWSNTERWAS